MRVFYKFNSAKVSYREYWWDTKSPLFLLAVPIKLFGIPIRGSTDDPNVETLAPFEVDEASIPKEIRDRFAPLAEELHDLGFHSPIFHRIEIHFTETTIYWATFCHRSGRGCARIHCRLWNKAPRPLRGLFPIFISGFQDGGYLVSSAGKPDMLAPSNCEVHYHRGASPTDLWRAHENELEQHRDRKTVPTSTPAQVRVLTEAHHATLRDFHLERGVFVPFPESSQSEIEPAAPESAASTLPVENADVLAEVERIQAKKSGWLSGLLILLFSIGVFAGVGAGGVKGAAKDLSSWKMLAIIIPILLIHELGHLVTMRMFKYRNLRMFFIPLFGAAVTGRNYNVSGWKKALVALAGPVPGITLAAILGSVGVYAGHAWLVRASLFGLILNAFILLPFLPLDGGRVAHAALFCRHRVLDLGFQVLAILALLALGTLSGDRVLMYVAIPMFLALPNSYRTSKIADRLRASGFPLPPPSEAGLPPEFAGEIIREVNSTFPRKLSARLKATFVLNVFESLNARPPGWLGTIVLLGVQATSVVVAIVFAVIFVVAPRADLAQAARLVAERPKTPYVRGSTLAWPAQQPAETLEQRPTLTANFPDRARGETIFRALSGRVPPGARLTLFGRTLLVSFPEGNEKQIEKFAALLRKDTDQVAVNGSHVVCRVFAMAPKDAVAETLKSELELYLSCGSVGAALIPPWWPLWARSPNVAQWRKSRQTYVRLSSAFSGGLFTSPEYAEAAKEMREAMLRGARKEADQSLEKMVRLQHDEEHKQFQALRAEGSERVDIALIDGYSAWRETAEKQHKQQAAKPVPFPRALAERMGVLPGGKRPEHKDGMDTFWGHAEQSRRFLTVTFTPRQIESDLPALAEWLYAQGCKEVWYDCFVGKSGEEADADED
jgi:Zn-dependent protease/vacuolar-type H+-ATPase subunit H